MSYNIELQSNNADLEAILETANNLSEAAAEDAVLFTAQNLTNSEKLQARSNIGAQIIGDYALKSELPSNTITIVGTDESGILHTWTVYGEVIS